MPTYQYACTSEACGLQFERVQSFTDEAISDCPECAGRVRKVYGSVGVVFKGSGFYRTDNRNEKSTSSSSSTSQASGGSSSDSSAGGSGGSDGSNAKKSGSATSDTKAATAAAS